MNPEKIAQLLNELQAELSDTDGLDPEVSERLQAAADEIRAAISAETVEQPHGVVEQLRDAASRFEDSHPTLTGTVGRIADALSQIGI